MFQNMMQSAIQSTLRHYITNLERLDFSLWGGTIDLKNINLNEDAMDQLCGFSNVNLRLSSSFIDRVTVEIPIIDFLSRPFLHIKANSLYATLSLSTTRKEVEEVKKEVMSMSSEEYVQKSSEPSGQEESILNSLKLKISSNLNVELKKAKIILFSDLEKGFDIVLKIKNLHIINNKQSPIISQIEGLEKDDNFENCNTFMSIGRLSLVYYESSLKKTKRFTVLSEHRNIRLFNFISTTTMTSRTIIKFPETLEVRINPMIYQKVCLLWNFMTTIRSPQVIQVQQYTIKKFETEVDFSNIQVHIVAEDDGALNYIADIQRFKLELSLFASVYKQQYSFGSVIFKYHCQATDSYSVLLSIMTSNLMSVEIQSLHQKVDYTIRADDVIVRLFKLEESLKFIEDTCKTQRQLSQLLLKYSSQSSASPNSKDFRGQGMLIRPRMTINIKLFEIELIDTDAGTGDTKLTLSVEGIEGFENKQLKQCQINFASISFKIFDTSLIEGIEMKYLFDEHSQLININRVPIQLDVQKLNILLFKMGLLKDIDSFFKILSALAYNSIDSETVMPQEFQEKEQSNTKIQVNTLSLAIGYTINQNFMEVLGVDIIQPILEINQSKQLSVTFQLRAHVIERMTLHRIVLLDKVRVNLSVEDEITKIDANNLKLSIYPETIREIQRLLTLFNNSDQQQSNYRMKITNKTMKSIQLLTQTKQIIHEIKDNTVSNIDFIDFSLQYQTIRFNRSDFEQILPDPSAITYYDFSFNLHELFYEYYQCRYLSEPKYFFKTFLDLDKRVQFLLFIDCSNENQFQLTILERYSVLNKLAPGLRLQYGKYLNDAPKFIVLAYDSGSEGSVQQLINRISTSFQELELANVYFNEQLKYSMLDIYDDNISSQVTLPCQVYGFPSQSQGCEVIVMEPFLKITSHFKKPVNTVLSFIDYQGNLQKQSLVLKEDKDFNIIFQAREDDSSPSERLSSYVMRSLNLATESCIDIVQPELPVQSEIKFSQFNQGQYNIEHSRDINSKISIEQSYDAFTYLKSQLGLVWISESKKSVPIQLHLQPQIKFINQTSEEVFAMISSFDSKSNIVIAQPNTTLDVCTGQKVNHQLQVGLKVAAKLVFSPIILTIKTQTHFLCLQDSCFICFLKIKVTYDRASSTLIEVLPAFKITHSLSDCLVLMQSGQEFQQIVINEKNTLFRMILLPPNNSIIPHSDENINPPEEAMHLQDIIMNRVQFELKILDSTCIETHHIITCQNGISELTKHSPYDIALTTIDSSLAQHSKSVDLELSFDQDLQQYQLEIQDSQQVVFDILNKSSALTLTTPTGASFEVEPLKKIKFASQRDFKRTFLNNDNWLLQLSIKQKPIATINIDPSQLIDQDFVILFDDKTIRVRYLKLSKKRLALIIEEIPSVCLPSSRNNIQVSTSIDIKLSFLPFIFHRNEQTLSISLQEIDFNVSNEQVSLNLQAVNMTNYYNEGDQVKMTQVLALEKGFQFMVEKQPSVDDNLMIIKKLELNIPDESLKLHIDEFLKYSLIGFLNQLSTTPFTQSSQDISPTQNKHYLLQDFSMTPLILALTVDLNSKFVLQIEDAQIQLSEVSHFCVEGDSLDILNKALRHLTTQVLHSLHKILYHSNFLGKIPSIYSEARQSLSETGNYKMLAMLPNIAAKSVFKFVYNISSSVGFNIVKLAHTPKSDLDNYKDNMDQQKRTYFIQNLASLNKWQVAICYRQALSIDNGNRITLYIDECLIEIEGQNFNCHLVMLTDNLAILYEAYSQIKLLQFNYTTDFRKVQFGDINNEFVMVQIGLKKLATSKVDGFQVMNQSLGLELPSRWAEAMLSQLRADGLVSIQVKQ